MAHSYSNKLSLLKQRLIELNRAIVLFSGGVDSSFLLYVSREVLGKDAVLALIGDSPSLPRSELKEAISFCSTYDITFKILETNELGNEQYIKNDGDRCYFCKTELQRSVTEFLNTNPTYSDWAILDGLQADDDIQTRPGFRATKEFGVLHPLYDIQLGKSEIRNACTEMQLTVSHKPESACLSSRIMKGSPVTKEYLELIENVERILHKNSLSDVRARLHVLPTGEKLIRIELKNITDITPHLSLSRIQKEIRSIGADYVTLDLEGYRQGGFSNKHLTVI